MPDRQESSVTAAGSQKENKAEAAGKGTAEKETTGSTQNTLTGQKDGNVQQQNEKREYRFKQEQILRRTKTRRRMRLLQSCQWSVEQPMN